MKTNLKVSKADILKELQEENARWEALLAEIGEADMMKPGFAGDWTMKDVVAHLTGWRRRSVSRLQANLRHEPAPPPPWPEDLQTDDEINAWIYEQNRDRSLEEVLQDSREAFEQLFQVIAAFSESDLADPGRFPGLGGEPLTGAAFFGHFHEEHEPNIRAWLANHRGRVGGIQARVD